MQTHITDVCFAVSKNYVWDATSVVVDPAKPIAAQVCRLHTTIPQLIFIITQNGRNILLSFFSTQWPGVSYPFSKMTSFQGHADMEYPMMINDGTTKNLTVCTNGTGP